MSAVFQIINDCVFFCKPIEKWLHENKISFNSIAGFKRSIIFYNIRNNRRFRMENIEDLNGLTIDGVISLLIEKLQLNVIDVKDTVTIQYNDIQVTMYRDDFIEFLHSHKIDVFKEERS